MYTQAINQSINATNKHHTNKNKQLAHTTHTNTHHQTQRTYITHETNNHITAHIQTGVQSVYPSNKNKQHTHNTPTTHTNSTNTIKQNHHK